MSKHAALPSVDRLLADARVAALAGQYSHRAVARLVRHALDEARALFDINLFAPIAMIQAALPGMRARRSATARQFTPGLPPSGSCHRVAPLDCHIVLRPFVACPW